MHYKMEQDNGNATIYMEGQFTFADNQVFKDVLAVAEPPTHAITLNLKDVGFVDSAALGMLLLLKDRCDAKNIQLNLRAPQGQVKKVFDVSRFDQLFTIYE